MSKERFRIKFAVYLLLRDGDNVLLSLRQGTGWKDGWYSLVSGHVDGGEPAEAALVREAQEEAGIAINLDDVEHVLTMHRLSDDPDDEYVDLFFEVCKWSGEIANLEPKKCGELTWVNINELPDNTLSHIRSAIEYQSQGKTYVSMERE